MMTKKEENLNMNSNLKYFWVERKVQFTEEVLRKKLIYCLKFKKFNDDFFVFRKKSTKACSRFVF